MPSREKWCQARITTKLAATAAMADVAAAAATSVVATVCLKWVERVFVYVILLACASSAAAVIAKLGGRGFQATEGLGRDGSERSTFQLRMPSQAVGRDEPPAEDGWQRAVLTCTCFQTSFCRTYLPFPSFLVSCSFFTLYPFPAFLPISLHPLRKQK